MGNYFEAVADSGRCIKLESNSLEGLEIRGLAYYKLNEHEMALNHWRQALHFDPEHTNVKNHYRKIKKLEKFYIKGNTFYEKNEHEQAIEYWKNAIEVDSEHLQFIHPTQV